MVALAVLGFGLLLAGIGLFYGRHTVIRRVTSRNLGRLAPGYAATEFGYLVYWNLVTSLGVICVAAWVATFNLAGVIFFVLGLISFVAYSIVAIAGEVRTYRALKR